MRYININKIKPGEKLGKDLIDADNNLLLRKNTIINDRMLQLLMKKEIEYLYIDDELTESVEIDEVIPQYLKNTTIRDLKKLNIDKTIDNAKGIVDNILEMQNLSVDVYSSQSDENSLFEHALAVTQLTVLFGNSVGFSQHHLNELAIATLLHDIGKTCGTNPEILKCYDFKSIFSTFNIDYPSNYDDKYHPLYGYGMLKSNVMLGSVIRNSILKHHENYDGTGIKYTLNTSMEHSNSDNDRAKIYAKIINISDTFVRLMTNTYSEIKATNITEMIEYMKAYEGTKFDKEYTEKFLDNVPILPKGLTVQLSNGMLAVIAVPTKGNPTRPKIIIDGINKIVDLMDPRLQNLVIVNIAGMDNVMGRHK